MAEKSLEKILYAEDEPDIQEIVKMALETVGGYAVHLCDNGEEAVVKAAEVKPDLILLDVMMPRMDGPTAMRKLLAREGTANIPIVLITAKARMREVAAYKEQGAVDVITKPFDPVILPRTVAEIWERFQGGR